MSRARSFPGSLCLFLVMLIALAYPQTHLQNQSEGIIKLSVELVVLDAQVLDQKTGRIIGDLRQENFLLYEDGVRQQITHFSQDKLPLLIMLLLDVSRSVQPILEQLRDGARQALQHLKPEDEVALLAFAGRTQLVQDFTRDRQLIADRIERISETARLGSGTFLNEAVYQAAVHISKTSNPIGRRIIITVTDNVAFMPRFGAEHSQQEAIDELFESGSVLCGLIVRGWLGKTVNIIGKAPSVTHRRINVNTYADQTGGEVINAKKQEVTRRLAELIDHLRTRYSLGYRPSNLNQDGKFRRIKLTLSPEVQRRRGELVVKTRRGYYAGDVNNKSFSQSEKSDR